MTPKRKKWWDSLPQGEKELREAIANHEKWIKNNKLQLATSSIGIDHIKKMMRRHKLITKALKHELERGGSAELREIEKAVVLKAAWRDSGSNLYFCHNCKTALHLGGNPPGYKFCPYCGKKLKEKVKSEMKVEKKQNEDD